MIRNDYPKISFGAKLIKNVEVKKYNPQAKTYEPAKASFVEFDSTNENDVKAIAHTVKKWKEAHFAGQIAENASQVYLGILSREYEHIYALTTQQQGFEALNHSQILGLADMNTEFSDNMLNLFQVKPCIKHGTDKREYKHVGVEILNALKKIYSDAITLVSTYSAANFYEKNGFKIVDTKKLKYIWKP